MALLPAASTHAEFDAVLDRLRAATAASTSRTGAQNWPE
jgi:hypothetical protein